MSIFSSLFKPLKNKRVNSKESEAKSHSFYDENAGLNSKTTFEQNLQEDNCTIKETLPDNNTSFYFKSNDGKAVLSENDINNKLKLYFKKSILDEEYGERLQELGWQYDFADQAWYNRINEKNYCDAKGIINEYDNTISEERIEDNIIDTADNSIIEDNNAIDAADNSSGVDNNIVNVTADNSITVNNQISNIIDSDLYKKIKELARTYNGNNELSIDNICDLVECKDKDAVSQILDGLPEASCTKRGIYTFSKGEALFVIHNIDRDLFDNLRIDELKLSVRTRNCLSKEYLHINTLSDLLGYSMEELKQIKGFGRTCENEIMKLISNICSGSIDTLLVETPDEKTESDSDSEREEKLCNIYTINPSIASGILIDELKLSVRTRNCLSKEYLHINSLLDLLNYSLDDLNNIKGFGKNCENEIIKVVEDIYKEVSPNSIDDSANIDNIKKLITDIPVLNIMKPVSGFISAFTDSELTRKELYEIINKYNITYFNEFIDKAKQINKDEYVCLAGFLKWCAFDLREDIEKFIASICKNDREKIILAGRSKGDSLKVIGEDLGISRERVRQIEARSIAKNFNQSLKRYRIMQKLFVIMDQKDVLTKNELEEYFGEFTDKLLYLVENSENPNFVYDKDLEVIVIGNVSLLERVQRYVDELPDSFNEKRFEEFVSTGVEEYDLPREVIESAVINEYKLTGNTYHRNKLRLHEIYDYILRNYYPNGLHVHEKTDIDEFKQHIYDDFGDVALPSNDRAIAARVSEAGILCDRGKYKAKQKKYISKDLRDTIINYLEKNDRSIFLINSIYSVFEERLNKEGIDNKYYLYGILKETIGDKWYFRRDYISKDKSITSINSEILSYIKSSDYPVSLDQLRKQFPGVTNIVLHFACSDPEVLNLFGEYLYSSKLRITPEEKMYIKSTIDYLLSDDGFCNCMELFDYINSEKPFLLSKSFIMRPFSMFTLVEYLFKDEYEFSRPFISNESGLVNIEGNVLKDLIVGSDEIDIAEVKSFAKNHKIVINSILDLINSCNDTHLLVNEETVESIELIGVNAEKASTLENIIFDDIHDKGTVPIAHLSCVSQFPQIDVPWTEWLIYSILKKWGDKIEVGTSYNQFRYAFPLVSIKGKLDEALFEGIPKEQIGNLVVPEETSNIDDLIMDYINDF